MAVATAIASNASSDTTARMPTVSARHCGPKIRPDTPGGASDGNCCEVPVTTALYVGDSTVALRDC